MRRQFLHLDAFGWPMPNKAKACRRSIPGILGEAWRQPQYSRHIQGPPDCRLLIGEDYDKLWERLIRTAAFGRDRGGKRLRKDAALLVSGVASFPFCRELVRNDDGVADIYRQWIGASIKWLRAFHKEALRTVIEHLDELYPHIHYFVVPDMSPDGVFTLDIEHVHPGRFARHMASELGLNNEETMRVYKEVMAAFQDNFHNCVNRHFGFERLSETPSRRYTSREVRLGKHKKVRQRRMLEFEQRKSVSENLCNDISEAGEHDFS